MKLFVLTMLSTACGMSPASPVDAGGSAPDLAEVRCTGAPAAPPRGFRNASSGATAALEARPRGFDLVTTDAAATQTLAGAIAYGPTDTALEDEDVELYACAGTWQLAGTARTDGEGHFALALSGAARLAPGIRDLYVSVAGDRSGAAFLGIVAPGDTDVVVTDIDGTLTTSENAFVGTVVTDAPPADQPGAATALAAAAHGRTIVYVSARGDRFTGETRAWLADRGFPRGALRLAPGALTLPGDATIAFKTAALQALPFAVVAAIGNRASDITAYTAAGVAPDRIYIKLPEYADEVASDLAAGMAIGFEQYDDLRTQYVATW